ncbi:type 2 isopentenyl-diphosphate Delta-isomerase, partial [Streptomyces sp. NPDC002812]
MIAERKDDHVRFAAEQQRHLGGYNQFDEVSFVHHALAGIDRSDASLVTRFGGMEWKVPLYINAMTGGSA